MTMKWIPIQKFLKKTNSINESVMVPERLIPSVQVRLLNVETMLVVVWKVVKYHSISGT